MNVPLLQTFFIAFFYFDFTTCQDQNFQQTQILQKPRFFKYRREQLDTPIGSQNPSFASIVSSKVIVVKQKGENDQENQTSGQIFSTKQGNGTIFVPTSGVRKLCKIHADCYGLREPDDWCPLPSKDQFM